jgi:hypothetical protein
MYRHSKENWVPDFLQRRPDVSLDTLEQYRNLYAVQPGFCTACRATRHPELPHADAGAAG